MDANVLVRNILKKQNAKLLETIAEKCGLNADDLKQKYLSPTFYCVDIKTTVPKNNL